MSWERGREPEGSREGAFRRSGRIEGEGAKGATSFKVGELGEEDSTEVAVVDTETLDPPDDE